MERTEVSALAVPSADRFVKRIGFNHPDVLLFTLTFSPGQALPPHKHPGSAVVVQVWSGSGLAIVDGREEPVKQGDLLLVTGEEELAVRNTGSEVLTLVVTLSPNPTNPAYKKDLG